jgi:hypothetical protein
MDEPTIYCEWLNGAVHQPVNTISNLVFAVAAVLLYTKIQKSGTKDWMIKLLPFAIFFIGFSSAVWHHGTSMFGDMLDTVSIAIFAVLVVLIILKRWFNNIYAIAAGFLFILGSALFLEQLPQLNGSLVYLFLFSTLGLALIFLSKRGMASLKTSIAAVILLFVGLIARINDLGICESLEIGTHFIWHIAVALGTYFIATALLNDNYTKEG